MEAGTALTRLKSGNERFVSGALASMTERESLEAPIAILLACSDAKVPPEMVFDQVLGDLYVVRVPGNVAAPAQIADIEHAAQSFGTRLVVVLGHSGCDAVKATLTQLRLPEEERDESLAATVERIRPAVAELLESAIAGDEAALLAAAIESNTLAAVEHLLHDSDVLESHQQSGGLAIVGAVYDLGSGKVSFFE